MMMKKVLSLILALALLMGVTSALADPTKIDGVSERNIKINTAGLNAEPDDVIAQGISPTTGRKLAELETPDGFLGVAVTGKYQPIMVQITNSVNGIGVNKKGEAYQYAPINASYADVVYECLQKEAGNETRMSMVFCDLLPDYVGFVRSTRATHARIRQEWNCAFCTSGYSMADVPDEWKKFGVKNPQGASPDDPGLVYVGDYPKVWKDYVWRLYPQATPNNEVFMLADIAQNIIPKDHKAANHTWLFSEELPEGGDDAEIIYVTFGHKYETDSRLEYDPETNLYTRWCQVQKSEDKSYKDTQLVNARTKMVQIEGQPQRRLVCDARVLNVDVTFSNVIVQSIDMYWEGGSRPDPELTGTGNADYFMGGKHYAGVWERKDYNERTVFYGEDGNEIKLQPGKTLIIQMPVREAWGRTKLQPNPDRSVTYE